MGTYNDRDVRGIIADIVREETMWLRHYIGQVSINIDIFSRGRVLVTIPELGFDSAAEGLWCEPRQGNSMSVPSVDDCVEVYFMSGDPNKAVYIPFASEMKDMVSPTYSGLPTDHIVFESPKGTLIKADDLLKTLELKINSANIKIDDLLSKVQINAGTVELNGATDFAVAYTDLKIAFDLLKTELNAFVTSHNLHIHLGTDSIAGPLTILPTVPPAVAATADMSASKVTTVTLP